MNSVLPVDVRFCETDAERVVELVRSVTASGRLSGGPLTEQLEAILCTLTGRRYAVAVASGTAALEVMFRAADQTGLTLAGREVLIPDNTFIATAFAAVRAGFTVRPVDCAPGQLDAGLDSYRQAQTRDSAAVCLVHIGGGASVDVPRIAAWCRTQGMVLFEDIAHALGVTIGGQPAGSFGLAAAVSLYATKIATSGEGGAVLTDDSRLARVARILRDHGKPDPKQNYHQLDGYNWRMSELQAAVGIVSLSGLDKRIGRRTALAARLTRGLKPLAGQLDPLVTPGTVSPNYYKFPCILGQRIDRREITLRLSHSGVVCGGEVYAVPLHRQPVLAGRLSVLERYPEADEVCARHICLPLHERLTDADIDRVASTAGLVLA